MSFELPPSSSVARTPRRITANAVTAQRQAEDDARQHEALCAELRLLAQRQKKRIDDLKLNTALKQEHDATLRRLGLEQRKAQAIQQMADMAPRLEIVRAQWNQAKAQNQGYEMEWGNLRLQYQQTKLRVDALREQIAHGRAESEETRKTLTEMREHLHRLDRDKAALRSKIEHALVCQVKDDAFLATRVAEEELYRNQVEKAMAAMEAEYQDAASQHQQEIVPLQDDVQILTAYLEEMQQRSKKLREKCLDLDGKVTTLEDQWLDAVHSVFEQLERANHLDRLKNIVLSALEQHIMQCDQRLVRPRSGNMDAFWLQNALLVWETIVKEVTQERQRIQIRDDATQLLAEVSQRCQRAKDTLTKVKERVDEEGVVRRIGLMDIAELHFLLAEKRDTEEKLTKLLQEVATDLNEDLSRVLYLVRKESFDDYVSSTEHEDELDDDFDGQKMQIETTDDISMLLSSIDLDPSDGDPDEKIRRMSHRPEGPLRAFTQLRKRALESAVYSHAASAGNSRSRTQREGRRLPPNTLERALMDVQLKVADSVIAYVRNRAQSIAQGLLDPNQDRLQADPSYVARAKDTTARIERWVQAQRDDPSKGLSLVWKGSETADGAATKSLAALAAGGDVQQYHRITIEGERVPAEIARANPIVKAQFYATLAIRGNVFQVYVRRNLSPAARQVFLSRDFKKILCRRISHASPAEKEAADEDQDLFAMNVEDITDVLLGHKTDVFRAVRAAARIGMREETAFSIQTRFGATLDIDCDSAESRTYWASIFAWVINELRPGRGILSTLLKSGKILVVNNGTRGPREEPGSLAEVNDRSVLTVQISSVS